ncbi:MAG: hypothetical protein R3C69_01395 [Geminicoccaceae bacterium]
MSAVFLEADGLAGNRLKRAPLGNGHDERWLQDLLFRHPHLIPLERIEPGAGEVIPICRELSLPKPGGRSVFLDILGVTPHGRPVLVECKLWRNPQARREVVAQLLEYAALLRRRSFADLTVQLRAVLGTKDDNPLFTHVRHGLSEPADEVRFVDAVARNLRAGDFHLIIAGEGIREDLTVISEHLGAQGARLALIELQLWCDDGGRTLVVPQVAMRTEVIRQRLILDDAGIPVQLVDLAGSDDRTEIEEVVDPEGARIRRESNREFWQRFIETACFEHPDQPTPRHGTNNSVRIPLPPPARWLTAYRSEGEGEAGLFLRCEQGNMLCAGSRPRLKRFVRKRVFEICISRSVNRGSATSLVSLARLPISAVRMSNWRGWNVPQTSWLMPCVPGCPSRKMPD